MGRDMMRVLVTGHRGYIGSVVTAVLRHARYDVVGLDCDLYRGCDFGRVREDVPSFDLDLRDVEFTDLLSFDAVVHLAALPYDAGSGIDQTVVEEVNQTATIRLAESCKKASVSRFVLASSCSVYGRDGARPLDERSPADPRAPEGISKLRCERMVARLADHTFSPVFLRHAHVYGISPQLRTDLMVNEFVASAVTTGQVVVRVDARAWHPVVHVEDLARAYAAVLAAAPDAVDGEIFNIASVGGMGADEVGPAGTYRVIDVADMVAELVPSCTRTVRPVVRNDANCRIDASKLQRALPRFSFRWTLPLGIRQLRQAMEGSGLTPADVRSNRYRRTLRLRTLIERGEVDTSLRRHELALA